MENQYFDESDYNPGNGYQLKKTIGFGMWKVAWRSSKIGTLSDRALLCYHNGNLKQNAKDMSVFFDLDWTDSDSAYITSVGNIFRGQDGRWWIDEELLQRPLSSVAPLRAIGLLSRYARDLCLGLSFIHKQKLTHGDLKLDNCGIDQSGRAKIFDIGSLTSSNTGGPFNVFTRPPEAFSTSEIGEEILLSPQSDVWSLGATIIALRTGRYPFVTRQEVEAREGINSDVIHKRMTPEAARKLKNQMDVDIRSRVLDSKVEVVVFEMVDTYFGGTQAATLKRMLSIDPQERPSAAEAAQMWAHEAQSFSVSEPDSASVAPEWEVNKQILSSIIKGEISVTKKQMAKVIHQWEQASDGEKARSPEIATLLREVKELID